LHYIFRISHFKLIYLYSSSSHLAKGMRYIERDAKEDLPAFIKTLPTHDKASCVLALKYMIELYQQLRAYNSTPKLVMRTSAEEQSIIYLNNIKNKITIQLHLKICG